MWKPSSDSRLQPRNAKHPGGSMASNKLTAVRQLAVQRAAVFLEGLRGLATPHEMVPDKLSLSMVDRGRRIADAVLFSIWRTEMNGVSGSQLPSGSKC